MLMFNLIERHQEGFFYSYILLETTANINFKICREYIFPTFFIEVRFCCQIFQKKFLDDLTFSDG